MDAEDEVKSYYVKLAQLGQTKGRCEETIIRYEKEKSWKDKVIALIAVAIVLGAGVGLVAALRKGGSK